MKIVIRSYWLRVPNRPGEGINVTFKSEFLITSEFRSLYVFPMF